MIVSWMVYAIIVSALLSVVAVALERALRLRTRPARWGWGGALVGSVLWPVVAWLWPERAVPAAGIEATTVSGTMPIGSAATGGGGVGAVVPGGPLSGGPLSGGPFPGGQLSGGSLDFALDPVRMIADAAAQIGWLDAALGALWAVVSLALLVRLIASRWLLTRRGWHGEVVDGDRVLISRSTGPAVVGTARSRIVLPRWALALDAASRDLLMAHEREHQRARDGWLVLISVLVPALVPWNPAAWWQARRLRLALEADCDARVLRRGADPGAYGAMLLDVARRASGPRPAAAMFLLEPRSFLERRIRTMTTTMPKYAGARATGYGGLAAGALLIAGACHAPEMADSTPSPEGATGDGATVTTVRAGVARSESVRAEVVSVEGVSAEAISTEPVNPELVPTVQVTTSFGGPVAPITRTNIRIEYAEVETIQHFNFPPEMPDSARARIRERYASSRMYGAREMPGIANLNEVNRLIWRRYPEQLVEAGAEGTTVVRAWAEGRGRVTRVEILESSGYAAMDSVAVAAANALRFQHGPGYPPVRQFVITMPVRFEERGRE